MARASNVIECATESSQGEHSAPFPRALVEFFVRAFSDRRDIVFDPFLGSGTVLAAAHVQGRTGYGCEISAAHCDVVIRRMQALDPTLRVQLDGGGSFEAVARGRGKEVACAAAK